MNTKSFLPKKIDKQTDAPKFWEQRLVRAGNNYVVMKYVLTNHLRTFLITSSAFFASSSSSSSSSPLLLFLITAALSLSTSAPYVLTNHLRTFLITPSAFFASSPSSSSSHHVQILSLEGIEITQCLELKTSAVSTNDAKLPVIDKQRQERRFESAMKMAQFASGTL